MPDFLKELAEKLKQLLGGWTSFLAVGSFLLYLMGYLATRFYLAVLGVGTDLAVLDERYVFVGAKFFIYMLSTVPIIVMLLLLPVGLLALLRKLLARVRKQKEPQKVSVISRWFIDPSVLAILGIIVAVFFIQVLLRKCFLFTNLLLAKTLPAEEAFGLERMLLDCEDSTRYAYFIAMVGGTILTAVLWFFAQSRPRQTSVSKFLTAILAFLTGVQFLFLPINYGVYIQDRYLPRVADLGDQVPLSAGHKAWLVWEGTDTYTYLVEESPAPPAPPNATRPDCQKPADGLQTSEPTATTSPLAAATAKPTLVVSNSPSPSPTSTGTPAQIGTSNGQDPTVAVPTTATQPSPLGRKLVSVPQKDLKRTTIISYDQIFRHIFCRQDCGNEKN